MMILGYAIIAVPTGLISVEMSRYKDDGKKDNLCSNCQNNNPFGSIYCNQCGSEMQEWLKKTPCRNKEFYILTL